MHQIRVAMRMTFCNAIGSNSKSAHRSNFPIDRGFTPHGTSPKTDSEKCKIPPRGRGFRVVLPLPPGTL